MHEYMKLGRKMHFCDTTIPYLIKIAPIDSITDQTYGHGRQIHLYMLADWLINRNANLSITET